MVKHSPSSCNEVICSVSTRETDWSESPPQCFVHALSQSQYKNQNTNDFYELSHITYKYNQ